MKYLIIVCLLLFTLKILAQDTLSCNCIKQLDENYTPKLQGQVYRGLAGMVGSDFFTPEYLKGDIYLENGEISYDQQLRYNGRIDGLVLTPPNSSKEILLEKYFIKAFCLKKFKGNADIKFEKIKIHNELRNDSSSIFGQVLYQNKLSLYAYRRFDLQDVSDIAEGKQVVRKLYTPSFTYYFRLPDNTTIGFKSLKKRNLYKVFPANKDLMRKIFREKHLRRFLNEEDLIQLTEGLNSLYN